MKDIEGDVGWLLIGKHTYVRKQTWTRHGSLAIVTVGSTNIIRMLMVPSLPNLAVSDNHALEKTDPINVDLSESVKANSTGVIQLSRTW
jgi:hypothetical protein